MKVFKETKTSEEREIVIDLIENNKEKYYIYSFLLDSLMLIDKERKEMTLLRVDSYGRISSIDDNGKVEPKKISKVNGRTTSGLVKRLNNNYSCKNARVVDSYIFHHLMSADDKLKCIVSPTLDYRSFLCSGDDLEEILNVVYSNRINNTATRKLSEEELIRWENKQKERICKYINNQQQKRA